MMAVMKCGAQAAAKQQGVNFIYEAPTKFDAAEQQQIIQSLLVKKIDGLIVVPAGTEKDTSFSVHASSS